MKRSQRVPRSLLLIAAGLMVLAATPACRSDGHASRGPDPKPGHPRDPLPLKSSAHRGHHHGHKHGQHRFRDAEHWAQRFENPARDRWQRPDAVVRLMKLRPTDRIADIGSATGYFPVRFARAAPQGKVYGFDLEPDMVRYLNARARKEGLTNLTSLRATPEGISPPEKLDVVFTCNTYHHIRHRVAYLKRLAAHLKPGARVVVVDYKQGSLPVGPPERHRVKPAQVDRELTAAGYTKVLQDTTTLPYQYLYIYRR